jgi:hypothetical protein
MPSCDAEKATTPARRYDRASTMTSWTSSSARRASLPLIAAVAYLVVATTPCPPPPDAKPGAVHAEHSVASHHGASSDAHGPSLVAACLCGCEEHGSSAGGAQREDLGVRVSFANLPPSARAFADEIAMRLPEAPLSIETPVPIAA